jgi:arginyl-tRNA synthetase
MSTSPTARRPSVADDPWAGPCEALIPELERALAAAGASVAPGWVAGQLALNDGPDGDLALPLHRPAASVPLPPDELARRLAPAVAIAPPVLSAHAVGGYLDFRVDPAWLCEATLDRIRERGERFGWSEGGSEAVCVEHTSANPTGPLHVGRIRNSILGDTFARVLRAAGRPVTTQYYVDDIGRQAAMITWIWSKPPAQWPQEIAASLDGAAADDPMERADRRYGRPYPAVSAYLKTHPDAAQEVAALSESLESGTAPPQHRAMAQATLEGMLVSLARIGVRFDELVWESEFVRDGSVGRVLERLAKAPHAHWEENGALAIDASGQALPKESTLIIVARANGTSLYVTRDIAYHLSKFARFPRVVDVLGQDHRLHARTLEVLLAEIGEPRRPEFLLYQYLTTPEGGGMSTRKGTAVYLDALLDEAEARAQKEVRARWPEVNEADVGEIAAAVGAGAVRYHILRVAADKSVTFRWEDALSFEGRSGPFVQYAFVRATSLLRKAGEAAPFPYRGGELGAPEELALVRVLARWPRVIDYTARTGHVHTVAGYAHDLAEAFNRFYQSVPVLKAGAARSSRLALVDATRTTLGGVLDLCGVPRLERM